MIFLANHLHGVVAIFLLFVNNVQSFSSPISLSLSKQKQYQVDKQPFSRLSLYKDPNEPAILLPKQRSRSANSSKKMNRKKMIKFLEKTNFFIVLFRHPHLLQYKVSGLLLSLKHNFLKLWRFLCLERYTVYILQCEEGKYYIGSTKYRKKRYTQHFSKRGGSAWTRCYRPLSVVEEHQRIPQAFVLGLEAQVTAQYMLKYGIQNVRGAMFCSPRKFSRQRDLEALIGFLGHYNEMDYKGVRNVLLTKEFNNTFIHNRRYDDESSNKNSATTVNDNLLGSSTSEKSIWHGVTSLHEQQKQYRSRKSH